MDDISLIMSLITLPLRKLRKQKSVKCNSCAFYREIDFESYIKSLSKSKTKSMAAIIIDEFKKAASIKLDFNSLRGLCILRNKRRLKVCRYYSYPVEGVNQEDRLRYHTLHIERRYNVKNTNTTK